MTSAMPGRKYAWALILCIAAVAMNLATLPSPIARAQDDSPLDGAAVVAALESGLVTAIAKAERSVVAIARVQRDRIRNDRGQLGGSSLRFGESATDPDFVPDYFGSGVIISNDGFIVTCAHVLGDPRQNDYYVWLDKRSYPATVVGKPAKVYASDPFSDLAVLKISAPSLSAIQFGDTDRLKKGRFVVALGNPDAIAKDGSASASWGIISNLSRIAPAENGDSLTFNKETVHQYGTLIQTDAKLNLGSSGGALIDIDGRMVGLTTSHVARAGFENSAGYAIATDALFQRVVEQLKLGRLPEYGFLGITPVELRAADRRRGMFGAKISNVKPGLPADAAGLKADDVVIQVGDTPIQTLNDLFRELSVNAPGDDVPLIVHRYRPGYRVPSVHHLSARLSKKYVSTIRPGYAMNAPSAWRGMVIEYFTALPTWQTLGVQDGRRGLPAVAVLSVQPGTLSWDGGLRAGYGIQSVNGKPVNSPSEFRAAVEALDGPVEIVAIPSGELPRTLTIAAQADGAPKID